MRYKDTFASYHPLVNFLYFGLVMGFTMFFMHPVCLIISLTVSAWYDLYLDGKKALKFQCFFMVPVILMAAFLNPAFNHEGETLLYYLPSGNVLTLESIAYGIGAACMLAAIVLWFACYNQIMTSDKFVYLFGRLIPALSLVLSMSLRFVPKFKKHLQVVKEAQRCIGRDSSYGSLFTRLRNAITIFSIMVTWAMENAIETADSMKSRGYGLPGRTAFSIYRFDDRDKMAMAWLIFTGAYVFLGAWVGGLYFRYYPTMKTVALSGFSASFMLAYLALCLSPLVINIREDMKWKRLRSEI